MLHVEKEQHDESTSPVPASASSELSYQYAFSEKHQPKAMFAVDRICRVRPREEERLYFRIQLNHVKGATSYREMKTVSGDKCESFREACR